MNQSKGLRYWSHFSTRAGFNIGQVFSALIQSLQKEKDTSLRKEAKILQIEAKQNRHSYRRSTHPTSVPLRRLFSNNFPLTIKESLEDYSYRHNPMKFQYDLLSALPFFPSASPDGRRSQVLQTPIDEENNYINEFVIYPANSSEADYTKMKHLILVHGYGGGLGFFFKNYDGISKVDNWCIHAIDLLGYGLSSRPPFKLAEKNLDGVEAWFHRSFDKWLEKRNLKDVPSDNILVVAHSMGAYLMATYGIKVNPSFCKKMVMVSPGAVMRYRTKVEVPKYFKALWEQNLSPFSLVRNAGPLGSKVVSGWSSRRFSMLPEKEATLLHKYAYGIFLRPGSGEYMLNFLLAPGADARYPLITRGIEKLNCDLLWCYGSEDWMDKAGGELCSELVNKSHENSHKSIVKEIESSGHHIYLDNYKAFNETIIKEMKSI